MRGAFKKILIILIGSVTLLAVISSTRAVSVDHILLLKGQRLSINSLQGKNSIYAIKDPDGALDYQSGKKVAVGQAEGNAKIVAYKGIKKYTYIIEVKELSKPEKTDQKCALGQKGVLDDKNKELPILYSSSDEKIVKVDEKGNYECVAPGDCTLTEEINGFETFTYSFRVSEPELNVTEKELYVGETQKLEINDYEGDVLWESENPKIAEVTKDGSIKAVAPGKVQVMGETSYGDYKCSVWVKDAPVMLKQLEMYIADEPYFLVVANAIGNPVFTSENPEIASVDQDGFVTPVAKGTTKIDAEVQGHHLVTNVVVTDYDPQIDFDETNYTTLGEESNAVKALIGCGDYYSDCLLAGRKKGEKWVYSNANKYVAQTITFDAMMKRKNKGGNCASIANWAFMDMGILPSGYRFYGDEDGNIEHYNSGDTKCKKYIDAACYVINAHNKSFKQLYKEGKIQTGDIMTAKAHTFIYRGNETFFACGHDAIWHRDNKAKTEDGNKAVFDGWISSFERGRNMNTKVKYIIRLREDYQPAGYRNKSGEVVNNPLLNENNK